MGQASQLLDGLRSLLKSREELLRDVLAAYFIGETLEQPLREALLDSIQISTPHVRKS